MSKARGSHTCKRMERGAVEGLAVMGWPFGQNRPESDPPYWAGWAAGGWSASHGGQVLGGSGQAGVSLGQQRVVHAGIGDDNARMNHRLLTLSLIHISGRTRRYADSYAVICLINRLIQIIKVPRINIRPLSYTHLRAHQTSLLLVCRLLRDRYT